MEIATRNTLDDNLPQREQLFGHPTGLFTLFFAEMWERFSYYGMRALLIFYMTKDFLKYGDGEAYAVYGAYTALVYMTPFFGGLLADRVLGSRRAVVFGGLLMAAGHLLMTVRETTWFYAALALLIVGNGFFKPNISAVVGTLYPEDSTRRDGGFTIFYMGVNLGAAMSPLLCGYVGERFGWHWGFGLATAGMIAGLTVFVLPNVLTQVLIALTAICGAAALFVYRPDNILPTLFNAFVGIALLVAAGISVVALGRGGLPKAAGAPPDRQRLRESFVGPLSREWTVYLGTLVLVPVFVLFVSGFSLVTDDGRPFPVIPDSYLESLEAQEGPVMDAVASIANKLTHPAGVVLFAAGIIALGYIAVQIMQLGRVQRERMYVVLILTFFSMLFWAFFELAGSAVNLFADRNVDRVGSGHDVVSTEDVGTTISLEPTQEQLGYTNGGEPFRLNDLVAFREAQKTDPTHEIDWKVSDDDVGMVIADTNAEIPASFFQSVNPVCILLFGLVFTALWGYLGSRGREPSTPFKFSLGLLQLGLGFGVFWFGTRTADPRGMVLMVWLILGYALHTTGELCLSPVGLSMITKLSPKQLVSTTMGMWFLATAFSQYLSAIIAQFTGISEGGEESVIPIPADTVNVYGEVFGNVALAAIISATICFAMTPLLKKWMHADVVTDVETVGP